MGWTLTLAIRQLISEVNAIAPNRDRSSDGTVGDLRHQQSPSGHNPDETGNSEYHDSDSIDEVRACDLDADLRRPGLSMEDIVRYLVGRCRSGAERQRIAYIIYRRRIWGYWSGYRQEPYDGANPHTAHAHVSGRPSGDADGRPYGLARLLEDEMPSLDEIRAVVRDEVQRAGTLHSRWREYVDEGGDGQLDSRTAVDILYATHRAAVQIRDLAVEQNALLVAQLGQPAEEIVAAVRAQAERTRAALVAAVAEQGPALAAAVAERLGDEVAAEEIARALAVELAGMLAAGAGPAGS
jgi:hypothetical protein